MLVPIAVNLAAIAETRYRASMNYQTIRRGLPAASVRALIKKGTLEEADVYRVVPERTFKRRLQQRANLKLAEADAIARLVRVTEQATVAFGDSDLAHRWLKLANPALGNEVPIELAQTDAGAREVEAVLSSFAHGDYL
jgi:putative toxin-antitoxin system antitoxin component (TIGR02293 family)